MMARPVILFVDDDPNVLQGLKRMLRAQRLDWEMRFAPSGHAALAEMRANPFDMLVTDMRMPEMSGAQLLDIVAAEHPHTVRYVLSGQANAEAAYRVIPLSQHFLSKPCDAARLITVIGGVFAAGSRLDQNVVHALNRLDHLPSAPDIVAAFGAELDRSAPSLDQLATIACDDLGLSLRLLQLANSSYFSPVSGVMAPSRIVGLLGIDVLRALRPVPGFFGPAPDVDPGYRFAIAQARQAADHALAIAKNAGLGYDAMVLARQTAKFRMLGEAALRAAGVFGATEPADAGRYLATLWGLPDELRAALYGDDPAHAEARAIADAAWAIFDQPGLETGT